MNNQRVQLQNTEDINLNIVSDKEINDSLNHLANLIVRIYLHSNESTEPKN